MTISRVLARRVADSRCFKVNWRVPEEQTPRTSTLNSESHLRQMKGTLTGYLSLSSQRSIMDSPSNYQESQDEMSFMNNLLSDIDASFLDNVSVSEETLNYQAVQENSAPKEVHEQRPKFTSETDYNISMLLDGAEEWDWDDMIDDALNVEQKDPKVNIPYLYAVHSFFTIRNSLEPVPKIVPLQQLLVFAVL